MRIRIQDLLSRLLPYLVVLLFEKVLGAKLEDGVKLVFAERLAGLLGCPIPQHRCPRRVHSKSKNFFMIFQILCGSRWEKISISSKVPLYGTIYWGTEEELKIRYSTSNSHKEVLPDSSHKKQSRFNSKKYEIVFRPPNKKDNLTKILQGKESSLDL
jgi:hypothetical protein